MSLNVPLVKLKKKKHNENIQKTKKKTFAPKAMTRCHCAPVCMERTQITQLFYLFSYKSHLSLSIYLSVSFNRQQVKTNRICNDDDNNRPSLMPFIDKDMIFEGNQSQYYGVSLRE